MKFLLLTILLLALTQKVSETNDGRVLLSQSMLALGFERDGGKVLIHWGIKGQGINTPIPFTLCDQSGDVLVPE